MTITTPSLSIIAWVSEIEVGIVPLRASLVQMLESGGLGHGCAGVKGSERICLGPRTVLVTQA